MPANEISDEVQEILYAIEEDFSIIKNVSQIMLKCLEDDIFTGIELQSLMITLNDRIWDYNKQLQKLVKFVEYGE